MCVRECVGAGGCGGDARCDPPREGANSKISWCDSCRKSEISLVDRQVNDDH